MKLLRSTAVVAATFVLCFLVSMLLDLPWISGQWIRIALVDLVILMVLYVGYLVLKEVLEGK